MRIFLCPLGFQSQVAWFLLLLLPLFESVIFKLKLKFLCLFCHKKAFFATSSSQKCTKWGESQIKFFVPSSHMVKVNESCNWMPRNYGHISVGYRLIKDCLASSIWKRNTDIMSSGFFTFPARWCKTRCESHWNRINVIHEYNRVVLKSKVKLNIFLCFFCYQVQET